MLGAADMRYLSTWRAAMAGGELASSVEREEREVGDDTGGPIWQRQLPASEREMAGVRAMAFERWP